MTDTKSVIYKTDNLALERLSLGNFVMQILFFISLPPRFFKFSDDYNTMTEAEDASYIFLFYT